MRPGCRDNRSTCKRNSERASALFSANIDSTISRRLHVLAPFGNRGFAHRIKTASHPTAPYLDHSHRAVLV